MESRQRSDSQIKGPDESAHTSMVPPSPAYQQEWDKEKLLKQKHVPNAPREEESDNVDLIQGKRKAQNSDLELEEASSKKKKTNTDDRDSPRNEPTLNWNGKDDPTFTDRDVIQTVNNMLDGPNAKLITLSKSPDLVKNLVSTVKVRPTMELASKLCSGYDLNQVDMYILLLATYRDRRLAAKSTTIISAMRDLDSPYGLPNLIQKLNVSDNGDKQKVYNKWISGYPSFLIL